MIPFSIIWQLSFKPGGEVLWSGEGWGLTRRLKREKIKRERVKVVRKDQKRRYSK